jgi:hypothetical protein
MFHAVLTLAGFNANYLDAGVDCPGNIDAVTPDVLVVLGDPIGAYESEKYPLRCKNCISCAGASQSNACRSATPTRLKVRASTERHCGPRHNRKISDLCLPAGRCSETGWSNVA